MFFVKKSGHALTDIPTDLPENVFRDLSRRFSITTAEELLAAANNAGSRLQHALGFSDETWERLIRRARDVLSPEEIRRFTTRVASRPGGVKMRRLTAPEMRRHAPGITSE